MTQNSPQPRYNRRQLLALAAATVATGPLAAPR